VTLLSYQTTVTGDVAVITLTGELDVAGSAQLEHELDRTLTEHKPTALVLDLSQLDFMDSTGLRFVVLADARAREESRRFALVRGNQDVHRIFEITRMADRLEILDSVDEASRFGGTAA
jgi:anti-sigma B factor antagonist